MIPDHVVDEVRVRADIVELIGEQIQLKRAGKDFRALCPFHHEKSPSFYVVPAKGFYKCFGCGESGDVFSFLMKRGGLSFNDAVRQIAARVGVDVPEDTPRQQDEPNKPLFEAVAFAADFFQRHLWEEPTGAAARAYLEKRGVPRAAAERFGLGYAPDDWRALRDAAHRHGIDDEILLAAGLIKESDRDGKEPYDRFRDRIIFPVADVPGRIIAFGGRVLQNAEGAPKYLNSPETPIYHKGGLLYGLNWSRHAIRKEGSALIVEGYMDYLMLAAHGVEHVVAGMGTAMTPEQANLLARYTGRAYLLYDSDTAGLRATFRTGDALLRAGVHPLVVTLPEGQDPDSVVRSGGAAALKRHVDGAADIIERKLQLLDQHHFLDDIEGTRRALDRLLPTMRATIDKALQDLYVDRVSKRLGISKATLEGEVQAPEGRRSASAGLAARSRPAERRPTGPVPAPHDAADERLLILLLLRDPERVPAAAAALAETDLGDPLYREIFAALVDGTLTEGNLVPAGREPLSLAAEKRVAELRADRVEITDAQKSFDDAVAGIHTRGLFLELDAIDRRARVADEAELQVLMAERHRLLVRLRELSPALGFKRSRRYRKLTKPRASED